MKLFSKLLGLSVAATLVLAGCGTESKEASKEAKSSESSKKENKASFGPNDVEKFYATADDHKGAKVEVYGKIFVTPERDKDGTYLQVFIDKKGTDGNALVGIEDPDLDVKEGDIIHIVGTLKGSEDGENAMGAKLTLPIIHADKIEKTDYVTAFSPAKKTIEVNKEVNQHGAVVKLNKIEIADGETRLYVTAVNNTQNKFNIYNYNAKLLQGSQQMEVQDNYDAEYPEFPGEVLPGVTSEAVIAFPEVAESGQLKFLIEGNTDNYELDFSEYTFDIQY
jgi:hypothetical protein